MNNHSVFEAPFVVETGETAGNMYRLGWDERNGGNISMLLEEEEVGQYLDLTKVIREIPVDFDAAPLEGRYFIITGTGKYFKNIAKDPETNLGIIRIGKGGHTAELLWGFRNGGAPTSEFPAHLMSHISRLGVDPQHRVVMHCHPQYIIAMNRVVPADTKEFTHRLWQSNTEAVIVYPDGVAVLPCMVCGTKEIGELTAETMKKFRIVVWSNHGIYGVGHDLDEAFGLIETVEKMAQIYMLSFPHAINVIPDATIQALADRFQVTPLEGILQL